MESGTLNATRNSQVLRRNSKRSSIHATAYPGIRTNSGNRHTAARLAEMSVRVKLCNRPNVGQWLASDQDPKRYDDAVN